MIATLAFAVVAPAAVTYSTLRLARVSRPLAFAVAPGLGLGISSTIYFILLLTASHDAVLFLDASLWLIALGSVTLIRRQGGVIEPRPVDGAGRSGREWTPALAASAVGCVGLVAMAVTAIWLHMRVMPYGETDAIAIWNLRARSLAYVPDWTAILSPAIGWSHPDYPLLLPLSVARVWAYAGSSENVAVPRFVALLFFMSSVATVGVSVAHLRGATAGLLSAMALVAARTYVFQVSCQCADVPIGFFILVTAIFVVLARESEPLLIVAGAAAGFAAWTKNEGQLLFVVVVGFVLIAFPKRLRALRLILVGGAVPLVTVVLFKWLLSPPNLFLSQPGEAIAEKLFHAGRWRLVLTHTWDLLQRWGGVPGGALAWIGLAVVLAGRTDRQGAVRGASGLFVVTAMLAGYLVFYAITPLPLSWHIATSFERLVVQLWPAAVWAVFQLTGGPIGNSPDSAFDSPLDGGRPHSGADTPIPRNLRG